MIDNLHLPTMYTALAIGAVIIIAYIFIQRWKEYNNVRR